jgi:hypothetical protein
MLKKIKKYFNEGNIFYGLEISGANKELNYHLCETKRVQDELSVTKALNATSLNLISKSIKKNAPLVVIINTSDVISKIIENLAFKDIESLVHNYFPNLDFNAFYYEVIQSEHLNIISIIKKDKLETYINELQLNNYSVATFSIGISSIANVLKYFNQNTIYASNFYLKLDDQKVKKYIQSTSDEQTQSFTYKINDLEISSSTILGFSNILNFIQSKNTYFSNTTKYKDQILFDFKNKRYFNFLLKSSLILILSILFLNFLVFNFYFTEVNLLQSSTNLNFVNRDNFTELKEEVDSTEKRVEGILGSSISKSTLYLDQIAESVPYTILLTELTYQPILKPIRSSKKIEVDQYILLVSGISSNSEAFSNWLQKLESYSWIKKSQTLDYDYVNSMNSNFSIKLTIYE